jgi:UDP-glucuronate 4-epimerase
MTAPSAEPARRYLVTGALGAIGAWTLRALVDRGREVVIYDLGGSMHRLAIALAPDEIPGVARAAEESERSGGSSGRRRRAPTGSRVVVERGDITDLPALEAVLDRHEITNVIHLAALQVPFVRADPPLGAAVNVVGTTNVLEAVRRRADRIGPLVYASSIAAFGPDATAPGEGEPGTLYGVFKRANESTAVRYFEDYGVPSIGLRPHTVYGPARDQGLTSAPTVAMLAAAARVPYRIPFGGAMQLQYAPDVGEAFVRASEAASDGAVVHNLDGPVASVDEIIAAIEEAAPEAGGLISAEAEPLPFPPGVDGSGFVALIGGSVMRPAREGIADAVARFTELLADGRVVPPEPAGA